MAAVKRHPVHCKFYNLPQSYLFLSAEDKWTQVNYRIIGVISNLMCMNLHASQRDRLWQFGTGALVSFVAYGSLVFLSSVTGRSNTVEKSLGVFLEKLILLLLTCGSR